MSSGSERDQPFDRANGLNEVVSANASLNHRSRLSKGMSGLSQGHFGKRRTGFDKALLSKAHRLTADGAHAAPCGVKRLPPVGRQRHNSV
jgi:hypothetical protein